MTWRLSGRIARSRRPRSTCAIAVQISCSSASARPGAKTLELVAEIRAARTNKRIISLVLLDDGHVHAARSAGADDVVLEDRITTDLLPALRRVVLTASS
jgi:DNA-binding NarL/FixJ family response regulator